MIDPALVADLSVEMVAVVGVRAPVSEFGQGV
jgi:hypothetical protein